MKAHHGQGSLSGGGGIKMHSTSAEKFQAWGRPRKPATKRAKQEEPKLEGKPRASASEATPGVAGIKETRKLPEPVRSERVWKMGVRRPPWASD